MRGNDAEPADNDAAVVDRLLRKLRASHPVPGPPPSTSAGAHASHRSGFDARPVPRPTPAAGSRAPRVLRPAGAWARVGLGVLVSVALTQWPYERACGPGLLAYLLAVAIVLTTGLWGAVASWKVQLAPAHVIALSTLLWGLVLAAQEIVPRAGHASPPSARWRCVPAQGATDHGDAHHSPSIRLRTASPRAIASSTGVDRECTRTQAARRTT